MKTIRTIWKYSLLVSLPLSVTYLCWFYHTYSLYNSLGIYSKKDSPAPHLFYAAKISYYQLFEQFKQNLKFEKTKADIEIFSQQNIFNQLDSDLPGSSSTYRQGYLKYPNGKIHKMKFLYRGSSPQHWLFPKKSIKIKTSKKRLYKGERILNLDIPKGPSLLNNHISLKLAKDLGLMAQKSEIVTLSINNIFAGIRINTQKIDESFLRKNNRMPNDIYEGNNAGKNSRFGTWPFLYYGSAAWDKIASNNHFPIDNKKPLDTFLNNLDENNYNYIDLSDFAKFSVFTSLSSSAHYDNFHNWIINYDSYMERFYTITRDPIGWWDELYFGSTSQKSSMPVDIISNSFFLTLSKNYNFLYLRQKEFIDFFLHKEKKFLQELDQEILLLREKLESTVYHIDFLKNIRNKKEVLNEIDLFKKRVIKRLSDVKETTHSHKSSYKYSTNTDRVTLYLEGRSIVDKIFIKLASENFQINKVLVEYNLDSKKQTVDISKAIETNNNYVIINIPLLANVQVTSADACYTQPIPIESLQYLPATYDIIFENISTDDITSIHFQLLDLEKTVVDVKHVDSIENFSFKDVNNIIMQPDIHTMETWSGEKNFSGITEISNNIHIMPGTKIILNKNAIVKFLGKLKAVGSKNQPITFTALHSEMPWAAIVLKDTRANGSVLEHCIFENGSGRTGEMYEYTGMLSIHNAQQILINNCTFQNSKITDDMVHAVYSSVEFNNSYFNNSHADALDADLSNIIIKNCSFTVAGNDSVDLMTSKAFIYGSHFSYANDKGISVGENSTLLAVNNTFTKNETGIQSKDSSTTIIYNSLFQANKHALISTKKNWRYDHGGNIFAQKNIFRENDNNLSAGEHSSITVFDSYFDVPLEPKKNIIVTKCDNDSLTQAVAPNEPPFFLNNDFLKNYSSYHRNNIRGTFKNKTQ